ncbi:uncharacterized protein [Amphiura filiformis]|uniref:uncharacterized protein n=1 Tax=Amphiura filiformis TaxID=82378 RepID=UPI003B21CCC3
MSMSNGTSHKNPVRVLLWSLPRSLSTVLLKCLSQLGETQIINEPYITAYHMGPDRVQSTDQKKAKQSAENLAMFLEAARKMEAALPKSFDHRKCTYNWVKTELEAEYSNTKLVFCKDMAYSVHDKYNSIPDGYRHTFLIRHPHRVFLSWKKMLGKMIPQKFNLHELPASDFPAKYGFEELYDLVEYMRNNGEPDPIIIDADDLQNQPGSILSQYLQDVGVTSDNIEDLLQWEPGTAVVTNWKASRMFMLGNMTKDHGGFYEAAMKSTKFNPTGDLPTRDELSDDILKCVDHSMPFYEKLHAMRIKP